MTDLLTTKQVQVLLRVDRTTIYRMVEKGQLPAIRVGKQWRFARAEVEKWLRARSARPHEAPEAQGAEAADEGPPGYASLRSLLPVACVQLIQDAFAEMLGVMMVVTDMQGQPVTEVSNPCGFFVTLTRDDPAHAVGRCMHTWRQLAVNVSLEPRFAPSEMGLLCARGLIRVGTELKGMVVVGGIAPDTWPLEAEQVSSLTADFGVKPEVVIESMEAVFQLGRPEQERALRFVQRIADIFSHMVEDRTAAGFSGSQERRKGGISQQLR